MDIQEYTEYVKKYQVPPESPFVPDFMSGITKYDDITTAYECRDECTKRGMWAIVDMQWTAKLAEWIGDRSVLEVMAGAGWLAKALQDHGVSVTPTDNYEWNARHTLMQPITKIRKLNSINAVKKYPHLDILLMSWPPYGEIAAYKTIVAWGDQKPIVYIGEDWGGCNAPDEFFEHFDVDKNISIPQWRGLHDVVMIGKYTKQKREMSYG